MARRSGIVVCGKDNDYCSEGCIYLKNPLWQESICTLFHERIEDDYKRCKGCLDNVWVFDIR
jgi:Pyruvate/2-oxoacid:ferredoxin oxidoreductase delta subunit